MHADHENDESRPRITLGRAFVSLTALAILEAAGQTPQEFLARHVSGDWSELTEQDALESEEALVAGKRIFNAYDTASGERIWICSEAAATDNPLHREITYISLAGEQ